MVKKQRFFWTKKNSRSVTIYKKKEIYNNILFYKVDTHYTKVCEQEKKLEEE